MALADWTPTVCLTNLHWYFINNNETVAAQQRLQWTQIIWVCPDIWVFSVLDNRHLADICAFCQKCQFEVRKAWNALFLQLKPHEMHCKQADSAILKIRCGWNYANCEYVLFAYGLLSYSDFKQTRAFVAKRDMSQIRAFSDFFWLRFDSDNCDLTQTLLRHLSQKMMTGASDGWDFLVTQQEQQQQQQQDKRILGVRMIDLGKGA